MVQRNIEVDQETWAGLKIESIKRNKNLREFAGDILTEYMKSLSNDISEPVPKVIILAAGHKSRLSPFTDNKPATMIEINGKTLLERLLENFNACSVENISIVKGYKKESIKYPGVKYYYNKNYKRTKILDSLFCAESEMDDSFIVSYSDIWVNKLTIKQLLASKADIALVVDIDWIERYNDRHYHPIEEAEKVIVRNGCVTKIGKMINPNDTYGEFIGLMKLSKNGASILRRTYKKSKTKFRNRPFHEAVTFEKAYLTDMIQELIDKKQKISLITIKGGWVEIDTKEDMEIAKAFIK